MNRLLKIAGAVVLLATPCSQPQLHAMAGAGTSKKARPAVHTCQECGYQAQFPSSLIIHKRTHTGEKPYKCDEPGCGKAFTQKISLTRHMQAMHRKKAFVCSSCGRGFDLWREIIQHQLLHTQPFAGTYTSVDKNTCQECGYKASCPSNLTVHIRTHTGERPFKCDECGKAFTTNSYLNKHKRIHTGDKPFALPPQFSAGAYISDDDSGDESDALPKTAPVAKRTLKHERSGFPAAASAPTTTRKRHKADEPVAPTPSQTAPATDSEHESDPDLVLEFDAAEKADIKSLFATEFTAQAEAILPPATAFTTDDLPDDLSNISNVG